MMSSVVKMNFTSLATRLYDIAIYLMQGCQLEAFSNLEIADMCKISSILASFPKDSAIVLLPKIVEPKEKTKQNINVGRDSRQLIDYPGDFVVKS